MRSLRTTGLLLGVAAVAGPLALLGASSLAAQGWIEPVRIPDPRGPIEKVRSSAQVTITGRVARVTVEEWFRNNGGVVAEGTYHYPLPGEAVFSNYSLWQGDTELRGEMMDAQQARTIYENIVRARKDPALIELVDNGLIRARVFPIAAGETRKITLRYTQVLDRVGDAWRLRYAGGRDTIPRAFHVTADSAGRLGDPYSPTHGITTRRHGDALDIRLTEGRWRGDVEIFFPLSRGLVGLSLLPHRPVGEDGFFMLLLAPGRGAEDRALPRDVVAVLDISAYRSPVARESQTFALQLVKFTAKMIEDAYFLQRYGDHPIVCLDRSREFVQINRRYLLAIEEDGSLVAANTAGRKLLRHHELPLPEAGEARPFRAWNIQDLLDAGVDEVLATPHHSDDRVQAFHTRRHREIHFATLIEPPRRPPTTAQRRRDASLAPLEVLADDDPSMRDTLTRAARLRNEPINILVVGETGTGKERMARALHESSRRRDQPFVAINCAAMPESLIESELFGHEPGSFTGARSKGMKGLIAQADGGTLFLDEIGEMPLEMQPHLLRVLQDGIVVRLGDTRERRVRVRLIAATNRDLRQEVAAGRFREDLFHRLCVTSLRLPALRERAPDIDAIVDHLNRRLAQKYACPEKRLAPAVRQAFRHYRWPGNIRELQNVFEAVFALSDCGVIDLALLPEEVATVATADSAGPAAGPSSLPVPPAASPVPAAPPAPGNSRLDELERQAVMAAIANAQGNISLAARTLGISRSTLYVKLATLRAATDGAAKRH